MINFKRGIYNHDTHFPEKHGCIKKLELEWTLKTIGETGFSDDLADPKNKPFLFCTVDKNFVNRRLKWDYFKAKKMGKGQPISGYSGWIDFMQYWVVHTLYVISDDCKEFFLFYPFQNSDKHIHMLGRLCADHYLTLKIRESAQVYLHKTKGKLTK
jgi:hypothetical protein